MPLECNLPTSNRGYNPRFHVGLGREEAQDYSIPREVCDPIGYEWFYRQDDHCRTVSELLDMRLICHERKVNLLLDVPLDTHGRISQAMIDTLQQLRQRFEQC